MVSRGASGAAASAGQRKRFEPGPLSCSTGKWASDLPGAQLYRAPRSFSYQWLRGGTAIAGATSRTYTPRKRGYYSCRVTAANQAGTGTQTSAAKCAKR